jgi:hypothetical protein
MKVAISFYYEWLLHDDFLAGNIDIDGRSGVYGKIGRALNLSKTHYNTIKQVVDETIDALANGQIYEPYRKPIDKRATHKIQPSSLDMHQIAKLKVNSSFRITTDLFNVCIRGPAGLPPIGYTAIYNAIKGSNHVVVRTEKRPQSSDSNLIWVHARFQSAAQLIIRFGLEMPADTSGATISDLRYINRVMLEQEGETFEIHQIGFWDEKHIRQVVGEFRDHSTQFGFDEDGIYCPDIMFEIEKKVSNCSFLHLYTKQ